MVLGRSVFALLTVACAGACAVACSSSNGSGSADAGLDTSDLVGCDDPEVQTYAASMQVAGKNKVFNFVLVSSSPAPPADETNTWVLQIVDSEGNPVSGVAGTAVATMPFMSHGTTPVQWTPGASGNYTLTPLYFFMAGVWEVAVTATVGGQSDSASFYFCVAG